VLLLGKSGLLTKMPPERTKVTIICQHHTCTGLCFANRQKSKLIITKVACECQKNEACKLNSRQLFYSIRWRSLDKQLYATLLYLSTGKSIYFAGEEILHSAQKDVLAQWNRTTNYPKIFLVAPIISSSRRPFIQIDFFSIFQQFSFIF
jgi:hypothetical protein